MALRTVDLDTFFHPRTVAVVGASDSGRKPNTAMTNKIVRWAEVGGAEVLFVNPTRDSVAGRPCAKSLTALGRPVDLVAILVGDPLPVVAEAIETKARYAVIFAAGFAEVGAAGRKLQDDLEALVASSDLHLLGPNTNLNAFEVFRDDLQGKAIALITQSGHQGRPIFQGQQIGIRLSHWAPTGNEADLEVADFVTYFAGLDDVGAIACYIEGFKNGRTLQLACDRAARARVPVVTVKVGRTEAGSSMARAHTGHLTGSDAVVSAAFRQFGVTRVDGLDELLEVSAALARTKPPSAAALRRLAKGRGGRVCVYSISGGTGAHMADLVAARGLELPTLGRATQEALHQWIPPYLRVSNPVDNGGAPSADWRGPKILDAIIADPAVDLVLCPITGALPSMAGNLTKDLVAAAASTDKPVFVVWGSPVGDEPAYRETLCTATVPTFRTFGNAVLAAKAYFDHHRFVAGYRSPFRRRRTTGASAATAAHAILAPAGRHQSLPEAASAELLSAYGIPVARSQVCGSPAEAVRFARSVGYPVVMKISSPDIAHKSDLGLVRTGVRDDADVRRTYGALLATAARAAPEATVDGVLVAEQLAGIECAVGIAHDQLFGPVVLFGLGGVLVEVLKDVTFRIPPFLAPEARRMTDEIAGAALLHGVRGAPAVDIDAVVDVIMKVQRIAVELGGDIAELDVNPLIATAHGAFAADALVVRA